MLTRLRLLLPGAVALIASLTIGFSGVAEARHHHHHHHRHHHHGIPQHNGGDRDGDNTGGRSDGDGRV
jgi:hypothetical protein